MLLFRVVTIGSLIIATGCSASGSQDATLNASGTGAPPRSGIDASVNTGDEIGDIDPPGVIYAGTFSAPNKYCSPVPWFRKQMFVYNGGEAILLLNKSRVLIRGRFDQKQNFQARHAGLYLNIWRVGHAINGTYLESSSNSACNFDVHLEANNTILFRPPLLNDREDGIYTASQPPVCSSSEIPFVLDSYLHVIGGVAAVQIRHRGAFGFINTASEGDLISAEGDLRIKLTKVSDGMRLSIEDLGRKPFPEALMPYPPCHMDVVYKGK